MPTVDELIKQAESKPSASVDDLIAQAEGSGKPSTDTGKKVNVPEWGRKHPTAYGAAGAAYETLKPIVEAGGAAVGALGGTAAGAGVFSPATGALGAGLGYAGARQLTSAAGQALGVEQPKTLSQAAMQAGRDIPTGAVMEATGQIGGKAVEAGISKLAKSAPRIYESAMKPSTTLKESVREGRVKTALKEGIPVSKEGLSKSKEIISTINKKVSDRISNASGVNISREGALEPVGQLSSKVQASKIDPNADLEYIAKYVEDIRAAQPSQIPIQQAQIYKQTLNKELNEYYNAFAKGKITPPQVYAKTKAAMADGLRKEIAETFPELKSLNQREGSLIELNKSLERAVNRIKNREIIPLLTGIAAASNSPHSILKALAIKAIEHPEVKSKLAIALYKASPKVAGEFSRSALISGMVSSGKSPTDISTPDLISSAEAGTLTDYSRGATSARQKALEEAAGDDIPKAKPASERTTQEQTSSRAPMSKSEQAAYAAETERLRQELERRKQAEKGGGKKMKAYIPVKMIRVPTPDGVEELKYVDSRGRQYDEDPND